MTERRRPLILAAALVAFSLAACDRSPTPTATTAPEQEPPATPAAAFSVDGARIIAADQGQAPQPAGMAGRDWNQTLISPSSGRIGFTVS